VQTKNDLQRCTQKSSQFQAVKYVQVKTMCSDAPKNLASFKQYSMCKQKTICSDAPKNLASVKQIKCVKAKDGHRFCFNILYLLETG